MRNASCTSTLFEAGFKQGKAGLKMGVAMERREVASVQCVVCGVFLRMVGVGGRGVPYFVLVLSKFCFLSSLVF